MELILYKFGLHAVSSLTWSTAKQYIKIHFQPHRKYILSIIQQLPVNPQNNNRPNCYSSSYVYCLQVQFVMVFLHASQVLIFDCNYPKIVAILQLMHALYFLYLFGIFYIKTYLYKKHVWSMYNLIHMCVYFIRTKLCVRVWVCACARSSA